MRKNLIVRAYDFLYFKGWALGLWQLQDRRFLKESIFNFFAGNKNIKRVLFVGVQNYTRFYHRFFQSQVFMTIDCNPEMAKYGATRHQTIDFCNLTEKGFDLIVLNGVIGFGLDQPSHISRAVEKISAILNPDGWLVLGNNRDSYTQEIEKIFLDKLSYQSFPMTGKLLHSFKLPFSSITHEYRFLKMNDNKIEMGAI
jgi:hypothetical protein